MSIDRKIYVHFHPDERPFIDKSLEWLQKAEKEHTVRQTDFLDPREQEILQTLTNSFAAVQLRFYGGYEGAERKRAWIAPDYLVSTQEDFDVGLLAVSSDDPKCASLKHGDYLGAILGLGLRRDKIGDIHVHDDGCHCLAAGEMLDYLQLQLQQVHRVHVHTEILPLHQLRIAEKQLQDVSFTVASLRLDGIASEAIRQSRSKILGPIKSGKVRVNWQVETDPSKQLQEGDMIAIQGFGRFKLLEVSGLTKKGRIHVKLGKFI